MNNKAHGERDRTLIEGKALERYFELNETLVEFSRLFDHTEPNDRAIAIVGAAFLDTLMEHVLTAFLIDDGKEVKKLLGHQQPLGTFGGKVTMC